MSTSEAAFLEREVQCGTRIVGAPQGSTYIPSVQCGRATSDLCDARKRINSHRMSETSDAWLEVGVEGSSSLRTLLGATDPTEGSAYRPTPTHARAQQNSFHVPQGVVSGTAGQADFTFFHSAVYTFSSPLESFSRSTILAPRTHTWWRAASLLQQHPLAN